MDHDQSKIEFQNLPDVLKEDQLTAILKKLLVDENMTLGKLSYVFVPREKIIEINKQYLDHHYSTDIITFDYVEDNVVAGEIFVCTDEVQDNAKRFDNPVNEEFMRVGIHGLLHLVGYADGTEDEKTEMRKMEDLYLTQWKKMTNGEV